MAATLILAVATTRCSRPRQRDRDPNRYVSSRVCAGCHAEVYERYRRTGMARAFYAPSADSFPDARPYFPRASATWFQMISKDGAWYQRSWQIGYNGKEDSAGELKID